MLIESPICKIRFAGFESDTYTLAKQGWSVSAEQIPMFTRAGYEIRLALKHQAAQCYMVTHSVEINWGMVGYLKENRFMNPNAEYGFGKLPPFNVAAIFSEAKIHYIPTDKTWKFNPVDPMMRMKQNVEVHDFESWVPFRTINPDAPQIYVPQKSVPELLEFILEKQEPKQKQIREEMLAEQFRQSREGEMITNVPRDSQHGDIRCQILAFGT